MLYPKILRRIFNSAILCFWFILKINISCRKMSNNQISLLNKKMSEAQPEVKGKSYKVYVEDNEGNSYSTKLSGEINTI